MICKVKSTIEKHHMLDNVKSVAVGVSGGADSMCLLDILSKLKEEYAIIVKAVHLNHAIRGEEALRDEMAVKAYCEKKGIELLCFHKNIPYLAKEMRLGEEECGRAVRYACFKEADCDAIATAHTLSDSIETMLFNLLRGTGTKGLCGIPPVRDGNIIRPLIDCTREEIETYCAENEIPFVTDSTNLSDDYTRNYIRHNITDKFSRVNESFASNIASALSVLRSENAFLEQCAEELLISAETEGGIKASVLVLAHEAIRKRAIAKLLEGRMSKSTEKRHIDLADEMLFKGEGEIQLSRDLYISLRGDIISFHKPKKLPEEWSCLPEGGVFSTPYNVFELTEATIEEARNPNAIDADKLRGTLKMTGRRQGDSFFSKKRKNTKSLKKLFNEDKIPEEKRGELAVLREGESLVWLEGYGADGKYLPDENTTRILIIKKGG